MMIQSLPKLAFLLAALLPLQNGVAQQGTVHGKVLAGDGTPLEGATVYALPSQDMRHQIRTQTDHNGKFVLSGIPDGDAYISAFDEAEGYPYNFFSFFLMPGEEPKKVSISATTAVPDLEIRFGKKAARLELEILDDGGAPISEPAQLVFTRPDLPGDYTRGAESEISLLVPPVPFNLTINVKGFQPWVYIQQEEAKGKLITPGSAQTVKLTVRLRR